MDWSGLNIPFNMTDIINGVLKTFYSFSPLVWLVVGLSLAFVCLDVLLHIFRGEEWLPWRR